MRRLPCLKFVVAALVLFAIPSQAALTAVDALKRSDVLFERNDGQFGAGADYVSRGPGYRFALEPHGASMAIQGKAQSAILRMSIVGSDATASSRASSEAATTANYYRGAFVRAGVPSYRAVRYGNVYRGIDVEYHGRGGELEYDFVVRPGADPATIALAFDGTESLCLIDGALVLETKAGEIRHLPPYAYQVTPEGEQREVPVRFTLSGDRVGFAVGPYDRAADLVIDPQVLYRYYLDFDYYGVRDIKVDAAGNVFVAGVLTSGELPVANAVDGPTAQGSYDYTYDAFVLKFNAIGDLVFSTYLGGDGRDEAISIALDAAGNAYVAGLTGSTDFPVSSGAYQTHNSIDLYDTTEDVFVTKLNGGGTLAYSTYLGGRENDAPTSIAVDALGRAVVVGNAGSGFPYTIDYRGQRYAHAEWGGFATKLSADGTALVYSAAVGFGTWANDVALDETGAAYIVGQAQQGFITTPGSFQTACFSPYLSHDSCLDAFVTKLNDAGARQFATYLGAGDYDEALGVTVDGDHRIHVVGDTRSKDFPVTPDALLETHSNYFTDGFYARLDPSATTIEYATYAVSELVDVWVDGAGRKFLLGRSSPGTPLLNEWAFGDSGGQHVILLDASDNLLLSTPVGWANPQTGAIDNGGNLYLNVYDGIWKINPLGPSQMLMFGFTRGRVGLEFNSFETALMLGTFQSGFSGTIGGQPFINPYTTNGTNLNGGLPATLSAGRHDVVVQNGSGDTETLPRVFEQVDGTFDIQAVTPNTITAGVRHVLTITGTGFPPQTECNLGDTYRVSATELKVVVSPGIEAGVHDVKIYTQGVGYGTMDQLPGGLTVNGPRITGVTPMVASSAGGRTVTIRGVYEDQNGGTTASFGGAAGTDPYTHSSGTNFTVPAHAPGRVSVQVSTPTGSHTIPDFLYVQDVTVTSISPAVFAPAGGTSFTITGSGFQSGARVTIDGTIIADVAVVSPTTIIGTAPAHPPGRVRVAITNPDGNGALLEAGEGTARYSGPFPQAARAMSGPTAYTSTSPIAGGANGEVYGEFLDETCRVFFGDVEATITGFSLPYYIYVVIPPHAAGPVDLTVTNGSGESGTAKRVFNYVGTAPTISSVSPDNGPLSGGWSITVTGTGFDPGALVTFDRYKLLDLVVTPTQITGTVPRGDAGGAKFLRVRNPDGLLAEAPVNYLAPPAISNVTPETGPTAGGTSVTISGSSFAAGAAVSFGGTPAASVTFVSTNVLTAVTPSHAFGDVAITVTNPDGQSATKSNAFRFLPPAPTITGFSPATAAPGASVTITGTDFTYVSGVKFFNNKTAAYTVDSATQITAIVPSFTTEGVITVTTQSGSGSSATNFAPAATAPEITSFAPPSGTSGTVVTITGLRFTGASSVKFGTIAAPFTFNSDTQITATVPAGAKTAPIVITSPGGVGTSAANFLLPPSFATTPFAPTNALPGAQVVISGANFHDATAVLFNGAAASVFTVDAAAAKITATVPAGATTGPVTVTALGGTTVSTKNFVVTPVVVSFTPSVATPGTSVVITGERFTGVTSVVMGGVVASSFSVDSATQITAVAPASPKTGTVCVKVGTISACSVDVLSFPPRFATTPFSPASGLPGTSVKISGVNFQGTSAVSFNGVPQPVFTVNSAGTEITAAVPAGTLTGPVTVTAQGGTATSAKSFGVPPEVISFTPSQGAPNDSVAITGDRFTGATAVKFGGVAAASFTITDDEHLTAVVSSGALSGPICVTTPGGSGCSSASFTMPPRITSFTPANALPGATIKVNGANLTGATTLTFFDAQQATPVSIAADGKSLNVVVPANALTGVVSVTTPLGTATSPVAFGVQPGVDSFMPLQGEPGTTVTVSGVRLTGASAVKFGGTSGGTGTSLNVVNDTQLTVVVPANGRSGTICVTTAGGTNCSSGTFSMPPRITSFSSSALPGASMTITGVNLHDASSVIFHDNQPATPPFTINAGGTTLTATIPAGAITGPVTVTTPYGTTTSTMNFGVKPAVDSFNPATGTVGTTVTITGQRFSGATVVQFGGASGVTASFVVNSDTSITATVPSLAKTGTICVTTPGGESCSTATFTAAPQITSLTPTSALPGAAVDVNGVNFTGVTSVKFNGVEVSSFTVTTSTKIDTFVPLTATTGFVTVTNAYGTATSPVVFGVKPEVDSFSPTSGNIGAGVTITGRRLAGATEVRFGGPTGTTGSTTATFSNVNDTTITATVPADARTGTVCVTTPGPSNSNCSTATFVVAPRVTTFSASALPGATITINGFNLHNATAVTFTGAAAVAPATIHAAGTSLTVVVPADAITGPVAVTTPAGTATSAGNFGVLPVIESFTPSAASPGQTVTVTGKRFTGATLIEFNGIDATPTVVNATTITAVVPPTATSGLIRVTTPAGQATSAATFTIGPKITSFSPTKGDAGTAVVITGSGFTGATGVSFNGVAAASFTVVSATSINATVPAGTTNGFVTVSSPNGTITSTTRFSMPPAITGFTPANGAPGASVTITGTNFLGASAVTIKGATASFVVVSNDTITATVPTTAAGSGTISVTTPHSMAASAATFTVNATAQITLTATATSTTSVALTWAGAVESYRVERKSNWNEPWGTVTTLSAVSYTNTGRSPNTTYLYRVVRVSDGAISNVDIATTVTFTDQPLTAGTTPIKAAHLTELRTAVNYVRSAASLGAAAWTDTSPAGGPIRAVHLAELRGALSAALSVFGLTGSYTDAAGASTPVKAIHFQELRNAVK